MGNPFVHIELNTDDMGKAKKFYGALFDWKLEDMKMASGMAYTTVGVGEGVGGGMMAKMPGSPTMWLSYVLVDDVKKSIAKAKKLGAQVHVEYQEVPGMGALGIFTDPTGALLALWQAAPRAPAAAAAPAAKKAPAKKKAAPAKKKAAPAKKKKR